jgi:hypothetical protein
MQGLELSNTFGAVAMKRSVKPEASPQIRRTHSQDGGQLGPNNKTNSREERTWDRDERLLVSRVPRTLEHGLRT